MRRHVKGGVLAFVLVAAAVEDGELAFVFILGDLVEGQLVEVLEQPRPVERVALLGAEDVDAGDGETRELVAAGRLDVVEGHAGAAPGDLAFGREDAGRVHFRAVEPVAWVDGETEGQGSEEADGDGHQFAVQEDPFEVFALETVVFGDEFERVGEVRGVWPLCFHVSFDGGRLPVAFEDDGQFEESAGDFGGAEIAELLFQLEEMRDELVLRDLRSVVVDQECCNS